MKTYDVIIIGGGHNGLVASIYLAMKGLKTLVVEERKKLGGMADTAEYKGVKYSRASYVLGLFPRRIQDEIGVEFPVIESDYIEVFVTESKKVVKVWRDRDKRIQEFEKLGEKKYSKLDEFILSSRKLLEEKFTYVITPPSIEEIKQSNELLLEKTETILREYLDNYKELYPIFSYDFMLSQPSYLFVYFFSTDWKILKGGMGTVGEVLSKRAKELGVDIITGSKVSEIAIKNGEVRGVILQGGERIESKNVLFTGNPLLLENLTNGEVKVDVHSPPAGYGRYNIILKDMVKINDPLKIDYFKGLIVLPQGEITIPSVVDETLNGHVITVMGTMEGLEEFFPDIKEKTEYVDKVNWRVVEKEYDNPYGNPNHLPMYSSYLFDNRPKKGWGYRTPIKGLYIGGSGAYPGGQVTGIPGRNAAMTIIYDMTKNNKY